MTSTPVIELRGVRTDYGPVCIHDGLDLTVRRGETLALVGGSGSGKTTLLREMNLLMRPAPAMSRSSGSTSCPPPRTRSRRCAGASA